VEVLVVEDDAPIRRLVRAELARHGLVVSEATSLASARQVLHGRAVDMVILDLTLPDGSGLDILRELRQAGSAAHVIVLSGAVSEVDRVRALELGADDYVVKPFFVSELAARVLGVRRRRTVSHDAALRIGHLEINIAGRQVTADGVPLELTSGQFDVLTFLATRPGHVFSRDELLRAVRHSSADRQRDTTATVTEDVRQIRRKIERDSKRPRLLRTVRGAGYRFDLPSDGVATPDPTPSEVVGTVVHIDGRIVWADQGAATLVGQSGEAELVGRHVLDFAGGPSHEAAVARVGLSSEAEPSRSQVFFSQDADGADTVIEAATSPVDWEGTPATRIVARRMTDSSTRLRHLLTGVTSELPDAVIITDPRFHIRSWNTAAHRIYGWAESEVVGRHILDVLPWAGGDKELEDSWRALEETDRWMGHGRQLTRDGSLVSVAASATVVRDDAGVVVGVVSVNRVRVPEVDLTDPDPSLDEELDLLRGLQADEFDVYYQPVVLLEDEQVVSVEALVRWNHPVRGVVLPVAFIRAAERSGSIVQIGQVVLDKACRETARWRHAGYDLQVAVNLSASEVADPSLLDRVTTILADAGLSPRHLWLEVTETSLIEDVDAARTLLRRLNDLGVRIAIDDFGTGWASLTYLREFPVHALKIDRTFVARIDVNLQDAAIARSILSLGAELGLDVVAEGIETAAQQAALLALGCSIGQGFLYGRPVPAEAVPLHRARHLAGPADSVA
jgi:PAS domain S-box-containing protein